MDNEEFKKKLSEVATWKIPETPRETSLNAKKKRGRRSNEEIYQEEHENVFLAIYNGVNPTYPPLLTSIRSAAVDCEACGQHCANGRKTEKKIYEANKIRHWRERCVTCGLQENPYTGEFDLDRQKASIVWNSYWRETKGCYASKGNLIKGIEIITFSSEQKQDN
jgi:hypothetical protein